MRRPALTCLLSLLTIASAHAETGADRLEALVPRWEEVMRRLQVPGAAVAVVHGDEVLLARGLGVRDPESKLPVTTDTLFYIASSTKSYLAMAIQMLGADGTLDLDRPVVSYLPRFTLADPEVAQRVTIRDLLSHRWALRSDPITQAEAYTGQVDDDHYYRLLGRVEPGAVFGYSNLHFTLLGRVVEAVTGEPWQAVVRQRILEPAGMARTTTSASELWIDEDVAIPTVEVEGAWRPSPLRKTHRTMHAAGGMAASVTDLATWLRLNLGDGEVDGKRLLSAERLRDMHSPQVEVGRGFFVFRRESYGLGWYVGSLGGETLVHHFGSYPGARAHVSFMPEQGIGVAAVQNNMDPTGFFVDLVAIDVYRALTGVEVPDPVEKLVERVEQRRATSTARDAERRPVAASDLSLPISVYTGRFENPDWGVLEIRLENGGLAVEWGDLRPALYAAEGDRFEFVESVGGGALGHFELHPTEARVTGVTITVDEAPVRFERR